MTRVLEISDLSVTFRQGKTVTQAVADVNFMIDEGETVALVGESGSGKSVTALSTVSLLGDSAEITGSIQYRGREMIGADARTLRNVRGNDISFIFQEPMTSLNPLHTIEQQLTESLSLHQGLQGTSARSEALELLDDVGIVNAPERIGAYPHQLSGGQRQRVMIAMALANNPDLLIADEPTTALDVTIQAQILALLAELKRKRGMSMLFITHDLGIVRKFADRVCVMRRGRIVEKNTTAEIFDRPTHDYTKTLLAAQSTGVPDPVPENAPIIAETQDLRVWFPIQRGFLRRTVGHVKAVNSAALTIRAGETVGLVGESGSGKTTLALALMRLISSQGPVIFQGRDIQGWGSRALRPLRAEMQIVFQDPFGSLSPRMNVAEIIAEGLGVHGRISTREAQQQVAQIMEEVELDPSTMFRYPHEFSGGQRQRIALARAMILRPKMIVLDEPTSALDMTVQVQMVNLLRQLQRKHELAYLFISHDLSLVRAVSHKVLVMRRGDIVENGPTAQIFETPQEEYTKSLIAAALDLEVAKGGEIST